MKLMNKTLLHAKYSFALVLNNLFFIKHLKSTIILKIKFILTKLPIAGYAIIAGINRAESNLHCLINIFFLLNFKDLIPSKKIVF